MNEQAIQRQVDRVLSLAGIENTNEMREIVGQIIRAELSEPLTRGGTVKKWQIERWRRSSPAALPRIMKFGPCGREKTFEVRLAEDGISIVVRPI